MTKMYLINFSRNIRNSLPKRLPDLLGGQKIDHGHHPWAGLFKSESGAFCTGNEHEVYAEPWRVDELKRQGVAFEIIAIPAGTADHEHIQGHNISGQCKFCAAVKTWNDGVVTWVTK
jgi:hypothetical protein